MDGVAQVMGPASRFPRSDPAIKALGCHVEGFIRRYGSFEARFPAAITARQRDAVDRGNL